VELSPSFDRLGLIAADAADLQVAWRALGRSSPVAWSGRVLVMSAAALGPVDEDRLAAAPDAARRLGGSVTELAGPSLNDSGEPRGTVITADAALRHRLADAESPVARRQLRQGAALAPGQVAAARERLTGPR
jgi:hypothetical protein